MHASNPETIYSAGSGDQTQARLITVSGSVRTVPMSHRLVEQGLTPHSTQFRSFRATETHQQKQEITEQTFGDAPEGSTSAVVLLLVIPHAALRSVSAAALAQVDRIRLVGIVVVRQDARHAALAEVLA